MRVSVRKAIATLLALSFSAAAPAQQGEWTGSRLKTQPPAGLAAIGSSDTVIESSAEALAVGRKVSGCMVVRHPAMVASFISADPAAVKVRGLDDALSGCLMESQANRNSSQLTYSNRELEGMLAEASIMARPAAAPLPVDSAPSYAARWVSADPALSVVDRMAICLAAKHPAESVALVRSVPASADEKAAMTAMMPHIAGCLVQGATLKGNRNAIRLAVAKALYYRQPTLASLVVRTGDGA